MYEKLSEWMKVSEELKVLKEKEIKLRKEVFQQFFPTPMEGTTNVELEDGWVLKGVHKINRNVDEAALPAVQRELAKHKVSIDELVRFKPELVIANYRKLDPKWLKILDQAIVSTEGSPSLTLVPPKG